MPQRCRSSLCWFMVLVLLLLTAVSLSTGTLNNVTQAPSGESNHVTARRPRNGHGTNGGHRVSPRVIVRPGECVREEIFQECFLCGKVTDDVQTYRNCCQRYDDIVSFCQRLLQRRR